MSHDPEVPDLDLDLAPAPPRSSASSSRQPAVAPRGTGTSGSMGAVAPRGSGTSGSMGAVAPRPSGTSGSMGAVSAPRQHQRAGADLPPSDDFELGPSSGSAGPQVFRATSTPEGLEEDGDTDLGGFSGLELDDGPIDKAAASAQPKRRWPTGASPDRGKLELDAATVSATAAFGDAPTSIVGTPGYAIRVVTRQRELSEAIKAAAAALAEAEDRRDRLLTAAIEVMRPDIEKDPVHRRLLEPLDRFLAQAKDESEALRRVSGEASTRLAEFDRQREENERQTAEARARREPDVGVEAARREEAVRTQAKLKRARIEQRAALQVVEAARNQQQTPPADAVQRWRDMEAAIPALDQEARRAKAAHDAALAALDAHDKAIAGLERARRQTETRRKEYERAARAQLGVQSASAEDAERNYRTAAADVARAFLALRGVVRFDEDTLTQTLACDDDIVRLTREHELLLRALDSQDREAVKRGLTVLGAGAGLLLLLIVLALVM